MVKEERDVAKYAEGRTVGKRVVEGVVRTVEMDEIGARLSFYWMTAAR